uniref:WWE domain-containing protein n=1 Tax=Eutreptiella gymnastica TaxID=73025 RepID=A0A7S4FR77_9EUGL
MAKTFQIFRASTLGETLTQSLEELQQRHPGLTEEIKERVLSQFDVCMTNALDQLNNKATIKASTQEVHCWEWRDDVNGKWRPYPPEVQMKLEETYKDYGTKAKVRINSRYMINFDEDPDGEHEQVDETTKEAVVVRRSPKGILPIYRCVDDVWSFIMKDAEVVFDNQDTIQVPYLKVVAVDGTRGQM